MSEKQIPQKSPVNWAITLVMCAWIIVMGTAIGTSIGIGTWAFRHFGDTSCK